MSSLARSSTRKVHSQLWKDMYMQVPTNEGLYGEARATSEALVKECSVLLHHDAPVQIEGPTNGNVQSAVEHSRPIATLDIGDLKHCLYYI
jgi:hypothetical protein